MKTLRTFKFLSLFLIGTFLLFFAHSFVARASDDFVYSVNSTYRVSADSTTRVEQTYEVTNKINNRYLDSIVLSTPVEDARNISLEYSDGTSIPFSSTVKSSTEQGYTYKYVEISANFPRKSVGYNNRWSFVLTYDTSKLVETKGSAHTVSIPAVSQDDASSYTVNLFVPENFGTLHTTGIKPTNIGTSRGETGYRYNNKSQLQKSNLLVFGDSTIYEVNFNYPLNNRTATNSTFTVTLPPNTSGQTVLVQSLDPQPKSTRLDTDGNVLADYDVPPNTNITVKTNIIGIVNYIEYNLAASGTKSDIPKDLTDKYTSAQRYWPVNDPAINKKAKELTQGKNTVAEQVKAINDYVVTELTYNNEKIKYNIRQGGSKALQNPNNAVCLEYSDLTISLLRAAGIPARMPVGYGYSGSLKQSNSVSDSLHSWVQAYVPNIGWMNLDPTWGEKFNNFGSSDLDHFAFALWGVDDDSPVAVTQNGKDVNYQYENTTITYKATPPVLQPSAKLSLGKWLILPFVSIVRYQVEAPKNTAGEDYSVRTRQGATTSFVDIGSLAPAQKKTKWLFVAGSVAWGSIAGEFAQKSNASTILASDKVNAIVWPMWVALIIIAGIILLKLIQSNVRKRKELKRINTKPIPTINTVNAKKSNQNVKK